MNHLNKTTRPKKKAGTTLVEVMLAAIIIAMLAVLASTALFYPTRIVVSDARRQVALHEANAEMERAKAAEYSTLSDTNYSFNTLHKTLDLTRVVATNTNEKIITVTIPDPVDADASPLVELITVRTQ